MLRRVRGVTLVQGLRGAEWPPPQPQYHAADPLDGVSVGRDELTRMSAWSLWNAKWSLHPQLNR